MPQSELKSLLSIALGVRNKLSECLLGIDSPAFHLEVGEVARLAVMLTEMAEDLHVAIGLWRTLEASHEEYYGRPLPLLTRRGEMLDAKFDARRFQFFLYTVWPCFQPDYVTSPTDPALQDLAQVAADYFTKAFVDYPRKSSIADYLNSPYEKGWDVKKSLLWLGTRSYLFREMFDGHMLENAAREEDVIPCTNDFISRAYTAWSGLTAVDFLASLLDLPEADRATLRRWDEPHLACYRVESLKKGKKTIETLQARNLVNDDLYPVRIEMDEKKFPFKLGQWVFGSLVPWRGEWYWSGAQHIMDAPVDNDTSSIKNDFLTRMSSIAYRYCPAQMQKAREFEREQHADFLAFYRADLVIFPDGLALAASEQKRMRLHAKKKAGDRAADILKKHGKQRPGEASYPPEFLKNKDGVALFYLPGEGTEMFVGCRYLLNALKKKKPLSGKANGILCDLVESEVISPAFVRCLLEEAGDAALAGLFRLPQGADEGTEYLLRRFKGAYYHQRYPCIALV